MYERCEFRNRIGSRCKRKKYRSVAREKLLPEIQEQYPAPRTNCCAVCYQRVLTHGDPNMKKRPTPTRWFK